MRSTKRARVVAGTSALAFMIGQAVFAAPVLADGCLSSSARLSEDAVKTFKDQPADLVARHAAGGPPMSAEVRRLAGSDVSTVSSIIALARGASTAQIVAIGAGLANAAHTCSRDPSRSRASDQARGGGRWHIGAFGRLRCRRIFVVRSKTDGSRPDTSADCGTDRQSAILRCIAGGSRDCSRRASANRKLAHNGIVPDVWEWRRQVHVWGKRQPIKIGTPHERAVPRDTWPESGEVAPLEIAVVFPHERGMASQLAAWPRLATDAGAGSPN